MATSRGERMQERMRGAGRHEVGDESFGFILPVEETAESQAPTSDATSPPPPPQAHESRSSTNISAKRQQLNSENDLPRSQPSPQNPSQPLPPSSASKADPYDLGQENPQDSDPVIALPVRQKEAEAVEEDDEHSRESLHRTARQPTSRDSISSRLSAGPHTEEVTESPIGAPGSGHRRRVRMSDVTTQSAQLQRMVMDQEAGDTGEIAASSPLVRKMRTSGATASAFSTRSRRTTGSSALAQSPVDADELSPSLRPTRKSNSTIVSDSVRSSSSVARPSTTRSIINEPDELSSPVPLVESRRRAQAKTKVKILKQPTPVIEAREEEEIEGSEEEPGQEDTVNVEEAGHIEAEDAEQIDAEEAARVIGKKRRRQPSPPREESPELDAPRDEPQEPVRPAKRRRQKRAPGSPAEQSQPKNTAKNRGPEKQRRKRLSGDDEHVPITVQRYTQRQHYNESDTDADILSAEIPFANRSGVNVIDVLAQMCDEVIDANLAILHEAAINADNAASKREYRTKLRALEAFQEELRTRLLEHTIALDTLHALRKRVRSTQKEKVALRNEIIRIRAEREQVALKMDAIRIRHEKESKQSQDQLSLSSTLHDIDLAVENGRQGPELGPKELKTAELANLELLVSRVAAQVATTNGNGNLKQIQEFNALLERAATVLEAR